MTKSVVFLGDKVRDILYYFVTLLDKEGERVLVITIDNDIRIGPRIGSDNIDWLYCKDVLLEENSRILEAYTYVLYEICDGNNLSKENEQKLNCYACVIATDLTLEKGEWVADTVNRWKNKSIVILRDITSKRFDGKYFRTRYPECVQHSDTIEIRLDSYNTYYAQCINFLCQGGFNRMSSDMRIALVNLLASFTDFSMKQIDEAMKKLRKGEKV